MRNVLVIRAIGIKKLYYLTLSIFLVSNSGCRNNSNNLPITGNRGAGMIPVEVMLVKSKPLTNQIFTTGTLMANEKVDLRNEIAGRITGIYFEEGTEVTKDKLLLKINDSDLRAQLTKNEAQEKLAAQEEFRKRTLLELKAISQEEYDIASNQLKTLQAERDLILAQIAKTEIYAPFSGRIGLRYVSPGSYLASNSLIASLLQTDPVKVEFSVPEKYSKIIKPGMSINFTVENYDQAFRGNVYAVESEIDPGTRTIKARAISPNPSLQLLPGKFARINIIIEQIPDAIVIPSEAISTELTGSFLYICSNGRAKYTKVTPGIRTSTEIQIIEGLNAGDSLILTGLLQLNDGMPVDPQPSTVNLLTGVE